MEGGGGAGCCGWMLVGGGQNKWVKRGYGDRRGAGGLGVNGLIDLSSPVHLLCLSISPVESTERSE